MPHLPQTWKDKRHALQWCSSTDMPPTPPTYVPPCCSNMAANDWAFVTKKIFGSHIGPCCVSTLHMRTQFSILFQQNNTHCVPDLVVKLSSFEQCVYLARDSSVGRAGDCRGWLSDIPRSAVRLRLAGLEFFLLFFPFGTTACVSK